MKLLKLIFCWLISVQIANAQKTEFKISTGYHFSSSSQHFIDNINQNYPNYSYKRVDASLGRGLIVSAGINHSLKTWLGISLDVQYSKSLPAIKGSNKINGIDYHYSEENKWNSQTVSVSPSLLLKIPGQKINPYTKFGLVVPVYSKVKVSGNYQTSGFGGFVNSGEIIKTFRLRNTIGYTASIGIAPQSKKKTSFFAEICLLSQSINAKKSTVISDKHNGVETIGTYNVYSKETIYVKKMGNPEYNPDKPNKQPGFSLPYSSIGLNVGINIKL